jgi:hypothetical protein
MPNKRSKGQKGVLIMMDESFRAEVDAALPRTGFEDRSAFIRDAVWRRLDEMGIALPRSVQGKPSRLGKGGRAASKYGVALVAETFGDHSPLSFHSASQSAAAAKPYPKPKRGKKKPEK